MFGDSFHFEIASHQKKHSEKNNTLLKMHKHQNIYINKVDCVHLIQALI